MDISPSPSSIPGKDPPTSLYTTRSQGWSTFFFGLVTVLLGIAVGLLVMQIENPLLLASAIVALIGGLVIFGRPEVGLVIMLFISYTRFSDVMIRQFGLPSVAKLMVALLVGVLLVRWIVIGETPRGWVKAALLFAAYGMVVFISLFYASDYGNAYSQLTDYVQDAVIGLLIIVLLVRGNFSRLAIWSVLAAGLFMSSVAVFQYLTGTFEMRYWGFGLSAVQNIAGRTSDYRIAGPFGDPNFFAQALVIMLPLAVDRMVKERQRIFALVAGGTALLVILAIIFTFSRGGFLALAVTLIALAIYYRVPFYRLVLLILVIGILTPFLPAQYKDRLATLVNLTSPDGTYTDVSFQGRTSEYMVGVMMFTDNPLLGVGTGNYKSNYLKYSRQLGIDPRNEQRSPHSLFIQVAAEEGLFGLFVFGVLLWSAFQSILTANAIFKGMQDYESAGITASIGISLLGYLTAALFIHLAHPRLFWVLIALALAMHEIARHKYSDKERFMV